MERILVAMDESVDSLRALALGQRLAGQVGTPLSVVSVVASQERAEPRRNALQANLSKQGIDNIRIEVETHDSAKDHLGALAGREEIGLCMMAHGRPPIPEMLIGSVTAGVVRRANRPIFLCGPRYDADSYRSVKVMMVCVDGSPLSEAILPHAIQLSKLLGARLQLLQVIDTGSAAAIRTEGGHADVMESGYVQGLARRLLSGHGLEVDWEILHGDPADSIVSYLGECPDAMLAMTTHGRSGLSQVVAGSVSHEVLHEVRCPVVILRPCE